MITSPPPATAAADSEDPDRGGGGGLRAAAVGFSPEIGAAIDNRARGANVAVTWYIHYAYTRIYTHVQFIYVCTILYASRRVNRHPRRLRPADYSRAPASLALSPANGRCTTTVTKIPRLVPLYGYNNLQSFISTTAAVLLSGCPSPFIYRLASGCVGSVVSAGVARDVYNNYTIIV